MAVSYSQNQFNYGGLWYSFVAKFASEDGQEIDVDNNSVARFECESALGELTFRGSLEYTDNIGAMDAILKGGRWACSVGVKEDECQDGSTDGQSNQVVMVFMVESVKILGRDKQAVTYKVELVSSNVQQCLANVKFSNYGKDPQPCFEIFKACAVANGLDVDPVTFEAVKSNVAINYISGVDDDLFELHFAFLLRT